MQPPSGHPDVGEGGDASLCPFAMIQAALDAAPGAAGKMETKRKQKMKFKKTDLMEGSVPEGISLQAKSLQEGLREGFEEDDEEDSPAASGARKPALMCPVSGEIIGIDSQPIAPSSGGDGRTSPKAPSAAPSGSRRGPSRAGGSSRGGSSRGGSKSGSKGGSRASRHRGPRQVKRRTKRNITFSEWEADTYIPQIKMSWDTVLSIETCENVGTKMYETLYGSIDDTARAMFTSPVETLGAKFAQVLAAIVAAVDNPANMHELLKSLAPMHIQKGVKVEYLPAFGAALISTLKHIMGSRFTVEMTSAWEWLWSWISQSFIMSIEEASTEQTIVSQSWDMAMDNCPGSEFGELLYDVLFEIAPNLQTLFCKPKQILSVKFMEMAATLVSFNNDPVRTQQQSIWLGLRHVRYGARKQHVQVMGQVIISTLERAVGNEWTVEMDKAWTDLWTTSCKSLLDVTADAELYGELIRKMWVETTERTTCQKFGSNLRKMLLSGTEWVQGLSVSKKGDDVDAKPPNSATKGKSIDSYSTRSKSGNQKEKLLADDASQASDMKRAASSEAGPAPGASDEKKSTDADAVGTLFWEMLSDLTELLWEPEQMNEKLVMLTKRFFDLGIRQMHLDTIGKAISTSMERSCEVGWNDINRQAWEWFWGIISNDMAKTLDVFEMGDVELIRAGWEEAKNSRPAEELGEIFFKELARIAPHVTHLFKRPKRIQALQFINVVEMLLCFNEDPSKFFADLKPLTIRHIKYGVKADYARAFGLTVLNGITQVLGDKFDERNKTAWVRLWTRVASCVTRSLNVGSNLVIVSLVQDDIYNFEDAMDCVPRGERFETLTHIDVNGEVISPLDWAVMGGQVGIASWIINDLLTIRADRNSYYYGRETMFATHPDLVTKLCKQMPNLIELVLDGLMWHASMVVDSKVRVNYYVQEMYGKPEENVDSWNSVLGELVQHGSPDLFNHPVVEILLDLKWNRFGLMMYVSFQMWYTVMLGLFVAGFAQMADSCEQTAVSVRMFAGAMAAMTVFVQSVVLFRQIYNGQSMDMGKGVKIPRFLLNPWNASRYLSSLMLIIVAFPDGCTTLAKDATNAPGAGEGLEWHTLLVACAGVLLWIQIIQVLVLSDRVSAFIYSVGRMSTDFILNFSVIAVILVAFGTCMNILRQPGGYENNIGDSILTILLIVLGINQPEALEVESWGVFSLILAIILIAICLFNILAAQLVTSYGALAVNSVGFAKMARAYMCVEMESFLWISYRSRLYEEQRFDSPLEFDSSDEGPTGGVQMLCPSKVRVHPKYLPDRVVRYTGDASPHDPWPSNKPVEEEYVEPIEDEGCID